MHAPGRDLSGAGEGQGRPHLARDRLGEIVGAGVVSVEDTLEQRDAILTRGLGKRLEGCAGRVDRAVDVGRRADGDPGEGLFGRRVDDVKRLQAERRDPAAADVELLVPAHRAKSPSPGRRSALFA